MSKGAVVGVVMAQVVVVGGLGIWMFQRGQEQAERQEQRLADLEAVTSERVAALEETVEQQGHAIVALEVAVRAGSAALAARVDAVESSVAKLDAERVAPLERRASGIEKGQLQLAERVDHNDAAQAAKAEQVVAEISSVKEDMAALKERVVSVERSATSTGVDLAKLAALTGKNDRRIRDLVDEHAALVATVEQVRKSGTQDSREAIEAMERKLASLDAAVRLAAEQVTKEYLESHQDDSKADMAREIAARTRFEVLEGAR
ncbi:MAG: hypothetical protein AMXMBFR64_33300 [Myxococcales bacterium]